MSKNGAALMWFLFSPPPARLGHKGRHVLAQSTAIHISTSQTNV
jgi:hypothetical protein